MRNRSHSSLKFDIPSEFARIIELLRSSGMTYPENYLDSLIEKYKKTPIKFPRIVERIGNPNIRKHFAYQDIIKHEGKLLDYGCGTGDDLRAIIQDGFSKKNITGYDIDWRNISIGYDFYLDKEEIKDLFIVSKDFPFEDSSFDLVYSGSILHVLLKIENIKDYIKHAFDVLKNNGIFFGSTLGRLDEVADVRKHFVYRMKDSELIQILKETHFSEVDVRPITIENKTRLWFYAKKP